MTSDTSSILHVTGDAYSALFYVPPQHLFVDGIDPNEAHVHAMPVGVEYIYRAIRAICHPKRLQDAIAAKDRDKAAKMLKIGGLSRSPGDPKTFVGKSTSEGRSQFSRYEIAKPEKMLSDDVPLVRASRSESLTVNVSGVKPDYQKHAHEDISKNPPVLVHWFGEMHMPPILGGTSQREKPTTRETCRYHLQIGLASPLATEQRGTLLPTDLANPTESRFLVVNVGEISESHRIRRSLSYDAIAVDLLRLLRGDSKVGKVTQAMKNLGMCSAERGRANTTYLIVRLSNAAVFIFRCIQNRLGELATGASFGEAHQQSRQKADVEEKCWLLCHKEECAPLSQPELGQMAGYTGFVSAHLGAELAARVELATTEKDLELSVLDAVSRSLMWQRAAFKRGCFRLLMKQEGDKWTPTNGDPDEPLIGYDYMFADVLVNVCKDADVATDRPSHRLADKVRVFDATVEKKIVQVEVDIERAVAHRTPWFMAWSVGKKEWIKKKAGTSFTNDHVKKEFMRLATSWVVKSEGKMAQPGDIPRIPIVRIGDAELTDRREVEDFLAIHNALRVYAGSSAEKKPLNIAVFGSPGSGKSFAVKQVVQHLSETHSGVFKKDAMTFNLSQFTSFNDLPEALHLVRNECLSSEIPIVFFDEFDSSFQGQPFGWLKYFLAPMQDGEFYHAGQTFKMGRAVFVFAGGVNRSFEELNGRVRNPSFCEAKGPDFISRLKAHLNVQGINEPEEIEADQHRYLLRRGILLRDIVRRKLGVPKKFKHAPLLHSSVAHALLNIQRFKHGVRSLEAIIKMCSSRPGHPIGPSDLPTLDQLDMHVDGSKLLELVDKGPH